MLMANNASEWVDQTKCFITFLSQNRYLLCIKDSAAVTANPIPLIFVSCGMNPLAD